MTWPNDIVQGEEVTAAWLNKVKKSKAVKMTAGESINTTSGNPKPFFINSSGKVQICDGNVQTKLEYEGFVITGQNVSTDDDVYVVIGDGSIVDDFTSLTAGAKYYVQDDQSIGTTIGTYEVLAGIAINTTQIMILKGHDEYIGYEAGSNSAMATSVSFNLTIPAATKKILVAMSASNGIAVSGEIEIKVKGKTSGGASWTGGLGPHSISVSASLSGTTLTITGSTDLTGSTTSISGTAYYFK